MSILKKGVRFLSQDADNPMIEEEIPFIVHNLTPTGMRRAAIVGFCRLYQEGYSVNGALEVLGGTPKEQS